MMSAPLKVFCCYTHEDQEMLEHLEKHLISLQRSGSITVWSDTRLNVGAEWEKEHRQHLENADIILLLISPDFIASDYCYGEMSRAMERHEQKAAVVIPILLSAMEWRGTPFAMLLPTDAKPIRGQPDVNKAFANVVTGIRAIVERSRTPLFQGSVIGDGDRQVVWYYFPRPLTAFVGREKEMASVLRLLHLSEVRLLTLTGPGGVGKTRLGLHVAAALCEEFPDGLYFVDLAPIHDGELVVPAIARVLNLPALSLEYVRRFLHDKRALLLLDNFEQVLDAAPHLTMLLTHCHQLKIVVTSRFLLRVQGEQQFVVPPLSLPDPTQMPDPTTLSQYDAIAFFLSHARMARPEIQLTPANAVTIMCICHRLDGLPLALELAAARLKLLSPQNVLERLQKMLPLLTGGSRDLPPRQRTMRATIVWSYELLDPREQRLFRSFAVFVGGCQLSAAEALYRALGEDAVVALDGITSLVDKHLLQQRELDEQEPRLGMLETVREYALEQLSAHGELERVQQAHASYYYEMAQEAGLHLHEEHQGKWLDQLEQDLDNLRAVMNWFFEQEKIEQALRLANALFWFWALRSSLKEGKSILERGLKTQVPVSTAVRARALLALGFMTVNLGENRYAEQCLQESLVLFQQDADKRGMAWSYLNLQFPAAARGDYTQARHILEQSLALFRELGEEASGVLSPGGGSYPVSGAANVLGLLASYELIQGEYARARDLAEECLTQLRRLRSYDFFSNALSILAYVAMNEGTYDRARIYLAEALAYCKQEGSKDPGPLRLMAELALLEGNTDKARTLVKESLLLCREIEDTYNEIDILETLGQIELHEKAYAQAQRLFEQNLGCDLSSIDYMAIAPNLEGLAEAVVAQKQAAWAARLLGHAASLREKTGNPLPPLRRPAYERTIEAALDMLTEPMFTALWTQGQQITLEAVLAERQPGS